MDIVGQNALVVEDDPSIRRLLRSYLEKLGFKVQEASTGKAALSQLEGEPAPLLVCLDLMLPELSGYKICEHIRATPRLKEMQVLVISARALPSDRALAEEIGANAYLIKPLRWEPFSSVVKGLFGIA